MNDRPTLAEIRIKAHKRHHLVIGNWLARRVGRPSAVYGTWLAIRLGLSAHQVTAAAIVASLASAGGFAHGSRAGFVAGVLLAHLAFWLDHVDGQVARWRNSASLDGVYLDYWMHHVGTLTLGFSLGQGLAMRSGDPAWSAAGMAIGAGWTLLALHNDVRYKAIFQRLKTAEGVFLVSGGAGGRPAPPARWPRKGRGLITWPLYKACEVHVILLALSGLGIIALVDGNLWGLIDRWSVRGMAILAPTLAVARGARTVATGGVEAEFSRWFTPVGTSEIGIREKSLAS